MARFPCKCGRTLSNTACPNDVQLKVYTDREWDDILNMGNSIDPMDIPDPKYGVWRCPVCERIYFFDGTRCVKIYSLEKQASLFQRIVTKAKSFFQALATSTRGLFLLIGGKNTLNDGKMYKL